VRRLERRTFLVKKKLDEEYWLCDDIIEESIGKK
jgi:hypothetical protein